MNLTEMNDEELEALRLDVINEVERRQRLAVIPSQITDLVARYEADGGDKSDLTIA